MQLNNAKPTQIISTKNTHNITKNDDNINIDIEVSVIVFFVLSVRVCN